MIILLDALQNYIYYLDFNYYFQLVQIHLDIHFIMIFSF